MPSYVITGASRGIGLKYVRQLSIDPENQVFVLVRNKGTTSKLMPLLGKNVHIIESNIVDHKRLNVAAAEVSKHTGGSLNVLINSVAYVETNHYTFPLMAFNGQEDVLEKDLCGSFKTNVIGVIHTINAFLPLLRAGSTKRVITISTGIANVQFLKKPCLHVAAPYGISKAGTNMVVTKYTIQFNDEGFVFLVLSPGLVNTLEREPMPKELVGYTTMVAMYYKVKPTFEGAITPEQSVKAQLQVISRVTVKDTGAFISHHGNDDWL